MYDRIDLVHTQVLNSPGATTRLSSTPWTLVTKLAIAVCSCAVGLRSWLRLSKA